MNRLWPLELSGVMTFGVLAILTLSTAQTWKERARLVTENQRLQWQIAHPEHFATSPSELVPNS